MNRFVAWGAGMVALLTVAATAYLALRPLGANDKYSACNATSVAGGASAIGGPFTLVDETGATVTDKDVFKGITLLYFGYTFCPDVCPFDSARTADAVMQLRDRGYAVPFVFVTVDPERDTPEVMSEFTSYFDDAMLGLTGTADQVAAAARAYRVYYKKNDPATPDDPDYLVDHTTFTYLVDAGGSVLDLYRRETSAEEMADSVACYVEHAS